MSLVGLKYQDILPSARELNAWDRFILAILYTDGQFFIPKTTGWRLAAGGAGSDKGAFVCNLGSFSGRPFASRKKSFYYRRVIRLHEKAYPLPSRY
jgi:hypothetical protein